MRKLIIFCFLIFLFINLGCQHELHAESGDSDYDKSWKQVKKYNSKGLPKSALKEVNAIYERAKKANDTGQVIKALIHQCYYIGRVEEEPLVKIQKRLQQELKKSDYPAKPLLHSMIAQLYWQFYQRNRYRFHQRTKTQQFKQYDIRTWSLEKIVEQVVFHYEQSLKDPRQLQKIKINIFDPILLKGNSRDLRPTLYDFLVHRAIDFFMNTEAGITKAADTFSIHNKDYLAMNEEFANNKLSTTDKLSFHFKALKYLQELIFFHINDADPKFLIQADLKRLNFVYSKATIQNKDSLFESILIKMEKKYQDSPSVTEIIHSRAGLYNRLGNQYRKGIKSEYRWHKVKALELCNKAIDLYPKSYGANQCRLLTAGIKAKTITPFIERAAIPKKSFRALINYRNLNKVHIRIVRTTRSEWLQLNRLRSKQLVNAYLKKPVIKSWRQTVPKTTDYQLHATEIEMKPLAAGMYMLLLANSPDFNMNQHAVAYARFDVSNIAYIERRREKVGLEYYFLHRDKGSRLANCRVQTWYRQWSNKKRRYLDIKGKSYKADAKGHLVIPFSKSYSRYFYIEVKHNNERFFSEKSFSTYYYRYSNRSRVRTFFFTDRSIYRPGQTVYFKGIKIAWDPKHGERTKIIPNRDSVIRLLDVNRQKVNEIKVTTNEYGTFSGTFKLPRGRLNGMYTLLDYENNRSKGSVYISVEEYKRPKFGVKFQPLKETFKLNDSVKVKGEAKAFGGYPIDNARVQYRITRQTYYPYRWYFWGYYPPNPRTLIKNGVSKTDAKGQFSIDFKAIPDLNVSKAYMPAFMYTIHADVTDINGETRSMQKMIRIGYTALMLHAYVPAQINKENNKQTISLNSTNLSGEFIPAQGTFSVYRLRTPKRILRRRLWAKQDLYSIDQDDYVRKFPNDLYKDELNHHKWKKLHKIFSEDFDTAKAKKMIINSLNQWKSGYYLVEMTGKDKWGNSILDKKYFTLYSSEESNLPYKMLNWFTLSKTYCDVGDKVDILIGSSARNVKVLYEIEHRGKIIAKKLLTLSREQKKITLPIKEKYRGNVGVIVSFIKHNRVFIHSRNISVPWSNKNLKMSFSTFRNKLLPGEKEQWRIKIRGAKKDKVAAEMVATLYDASLDAIKGHHYYFNAFPYHYIRNKWQIDNSFHTAYARVVGRLRQSVSFSGRYYDRLNWFGFYFSYYGRRYYAKNKRRERKAEGEVEEDEGGEMDDRAVVKEKSKKLGRVRKAPAQPVETTSESSPKLDRLSSTIKKAKPVQVRKNFNETAFFYPHLKTNKKGDIIISFQIPEAITKWKMMGFAHTKDLQYGTITGEVITQKKLMAIPNAPRFLRENDSLIFSTKINNQSDNDLNGTAKLRLFDAGTMKPVNKLFQHESINKPFKVKKGQSTLVTWKIKIPDNVEAVTYRVTAETNDFSDGEEKALPVLKNSMLVTESLPLPVRALEKKTFTLKKLLQSSKSSTLKHHRLTLEFTSNPTWYAVQALPYMMEYPYECLEQTFNRYYANSIATHIVNKYPKIKEVFAKWKKMKNSSALLSNLEKNQELKALLLQETPWVLQAKNETQSKKRIALLFDFNRMAEELSRALLKLEKGQMSIGAWPWFYGMRDDRFITQYIVSGLAHLHALKVVDIKKHKRLWRMTSKAIRYLDSKIYEDYDYLKRKGYNLELNHLGYLQIHYLYARSYFKDVPMSKGIKEAFNYYKGQAKKYWLDYNKYLQGMIALTLYKYDDQKTAKAIVVSIKEHALNSEEMGMYWRDPYSYYWYQPSIERQALLIEAFHVITNDEKAVDDMKTWLLKQKQTQNWRTTKSTAEACYALLLTGDDWLAYDNLPDITVGSIEVGPGKAKDVTVEAGTGYFKTAWSGKEVKPDMGRVTVKNNNKVVAWGALYWQYFEQLDKITPHKTPVQIDKKLFVERPSKKGPVLVPVDKSELAVGDRVKVRIEIRVDRNMEYVHMKDMRASCFEPENVISRTKWQDGLYYYESTKDASTNFFMSYLPKGTYVFEYPLRVTHKGDFSNGITTLQCMYAPEFSSHSEGVRVQID